MLIPIAALTFGVVAGYLCGGRLANLERLRLRLPWLAILALALQVVAFSGIGARLGDTPMVALHLASYALLVWFILANRDNLGLVITGIGMALNLIVIVANGGYMPASRSALKLSGEAYAGASHNNSEIIGAGTHLRFLGDIFAVPDGTLLSNVFSIGDVIIVVGVAMLICASMRVVPEELQAAS